MAGSWPSSRVSGVIETRNLNYLEPIMLTQAVCSVQTFICEALVLFDISKATMSGSLCTGPSCTSLWFGETQHSLPQYIPASRVFMFQVKLMKDVLNQLEC